MSGDDAIVAPTCDAIRSSTDGFALCGRAKGHDGTHIAYDGGPGDETRRPLVEWTWDSEPQENA